MNDKPLEHQVQAELEEYFTCARNQKCPPNMKKNLYDKLELSKRQSHWWSPKLAIAGLSLVFVSSVIFKVSNNHSIQQDSIQQAQADLQVAMHYMNRVSLKSLTAVNNKGIRPALIKPLARSVASL